MKKFLFKLIALVLLLTAADHLIKYFISNYFFQSNIEIIPGVFSFKPVHNTDMSWFGSLGIPLFSGRYFSIGFNILIFIAAAILCKYTCVNLNTRGKLTLAIFAFLFSGVLCSTVDRVFWGGSIDYLRLEHFFTFDLKDCYVTAFIILFACSRIKYKKKWDAVKLFNKRALKRNGAK